MEIIAPIINVPARSRIIRIIKDDRWKRTGGSNCIRWFLLAPEYIKYTLKYELQ